MSNRQHDQAGFITWADALQLMEEIQRETNTTIELHLQLASPKRGGQYLSGSLRARRFTHAGHDDNAPWVGFSFPHRDHKTVTGAIVARLYVLREYIERQAEHEKGQLEQTSF